MSANIFLYENLVKNASITMSPANLQYPVDNLKDDRRTKVLRVESSSMIVTLDLGAIMEVDSFAVVDSGINSFGFTGIVFEANLNNSWTSPLVSQSVPLSEEFGFGYLILGAPVSVRFIRLVISNTSAFCELSKIFVGKKAQIGELGFEYPVTLTQNSNSTIQKNRYGQRFIDEVNTQKQLSSSFSTLTKQEMAEVFAILDYCSSTLPLWIVFPEGNITLDNNRLNGYYYLTGEPALSFDRGNFWSVNLSFEEGT
jgi:hypothetical protein